MGAYLQVVTDHTLWYRSADSNDLFAPSNENLHNSDFRFTRLARIHVSGNGGGGSALRGGGIAHPTLNVTSHSQGGRSAGDDGQGQDGHCDGHAEGAGW